MANHGPFGPATVLALTLGCVAGSDKPVKSQEEPAPSDEVVLDRSADSPDNLGPKVVGIALTPTTGTVFVGETFRLKATGVRSDGSMADVTESAHWSTSNPRLATVNAGVVTAIGAGSVRVTATAGDASAKAALELVSSRRATADIEAPERTGSAPTTQSPQSQGGSYRPTSLEAQLAASVRANEPVPAPPPSDPNGTYVRTRSRTGGQPGAMVYEAPDLGIAHHPKPIKAPRPW